MARHIPFMNREQELAHINDLMHEWGTRRVVCIDGPGGVGKTWLLREVHRRYQSDQQLAVSLKLTSILDFDDFALHTPQNTAYRLAHLLDAKIFDPYLFVLHNWHRSGMSSINTEQAENATLALNQTFVNCFNMLSALQRVVLFIDTIDALDSLSVLQYMMETGLRMDNMILLLAGRNAAQIGETLYPDFGSDVHVMRLAPFSAAISETYSERKQQDLGVRLQRPLLHKLIALTEGRPVLLNLALEWAARADLPDWLTEGSVEDLQTVSREHWHTLQQRLHRLLAEHIVRPDAPLSRLLLLLSRLSPLDADAIGALLEVSPEEAHSLLHAASDDIVIRVQPHQRIALHADIQRMIVQYVWPILDPDGTRRKQDSHRIANYLEQRVEITARRIEHLRTHHPALPDEHSDSTDVPFMEQQVLKREMWLRKGQQLAHTLSVDAETGMQTFTRMFDEATHSYALRFRGTLFEHIQPYTDSFTVGQKYDLIRRQLLHLFDQGEYARVRQHAADLLEQTDVSAEQHVDLLLLLGNVEMRLGYLDQGVAHFERALRVCKLHDLRSGMVRTLTARGWAFRNQGKHTEAMNDYIEAYKQSLQSDDTESTAWILTNISFVSTLRGDRQSAFESCQTALKLWESSGNLRGKAAAYSTLGGFHVRFNEPTEAMAAYTRALEIFTREQDLDWMSLVRCGRAFVFQSLGELDRATDDLEWALQHGPAHLRTRIFYSQGLVFWARKDLLLARSKLEECRKLSQEVGDHFHDYKSFADLIELAWEFGEYKQWAQFAQQLDELYADREAAEAIRLRGSCLRKLGDLALCAGDYAQAVAFYQEGFPLLAEYEVHERYTIRSQMRQTDERIRPRISGAVLRRLGRELAQFWRSHTMLVVKYPEALLTFHDWEQEGEQEGTEQMSTEHTETQQEEVYGE